LSDRDLIFAAAHLAQRAPQEWAQFLSALVAYTDERRDECIQSPPAMLQVTQGRAQACATLRKLLADSVKTAVAIETKQAQKPPMPQRPHRAP
jgi:ribosomal protein RSM22 (predicted rRNA methylase)